MLRFKTVLMTIMLLILIACLPISAFASDEFILDDFENYNINEALPSVSGWETSSAILNATVVPDPAAGEGKSLRLQKSQPLDGYLEKKLVEPLTGTLVLEFRYRVNKMSYAQAPSVFGTNESDGLVGEAALLQMMNGEIYAGHGASRAKIGQYNIDKWHHYKLIFDTTADTYTVLQDGVLLKKSVAMREPVSNMMKVRFNHTKETDFEVYLDDVRLYRGEPGAGGDNSPLSDTYLIRPESFVDYGTWKTNHFKGAFENTCLKGEEEVSPDTTKPALVEVEVATAGEYTVWAHTRDFAVQPGTRFFNIKVNGTTLPLTLGRHGVDGWKWENAGTVQIEPGVTRIELLDTSGFFARTDAIVLTKQQDLLLSENYDDVKAIAPVVKPVFPYAEQLQFPQWAKESNDLLLQGVIENDRVRVQFFKMATSHGEIIKKRTWVQKAGSWIEVNSAAEEFGYLLMWAKDSRISGYDSQSPIWNNTYEVNGVDRVTSTPSVYENAVPLWMIPTEIDIVNDRKVVLRSENDYAVLEVVWQTPPNSEDPEVTCKLKVKVQGSFSLGIFNTPETDLTDTEFLLNPFRIHGKQLPDKPYLVTEQFSSAALTTMTVTNSTYAPAVDEKITYGLAVDPKSIPFRWVYQENSRFGLGIRGMNGGVQPAIFAPVLGMEESNFVSGQIFKFTYRPLSRVEDWFDTYRHVVTDIFKVKDYRQNYYSSLTEATLNVQRLLLDDKHSGWSSLMKSNYYIEGNNVTSLTGPLSYLQAYLLTEDRDMLTKRTIPTLEYLLTRQKSLFSAGGATDGSILPHLDFKGVPFPIGTPVAEYNTSVFGGAYQMTRGLTPVLKDIGIDNGVRYAPHRLIPEFAEYLSLYKYTGEQQYLDMAKAGADQYLTDVVYADRSEMPREELFIYWDYYPDFQALLDLYEVCGEAKYLDAAVEGARWLLTTLWTQGIIPDGDVTINAADMRQTGLLYNLGRMTWLGDENIQRGYVDELAELPDDTVPAWVPARVGLGVEQASTFAGNDSANILLSVWAADLLKLSHYTGDSIYETFARNAVIGRFSNYPGYYQNQFYVKQMQENYPYSGIDVTGIYSSHIPTFLGMVQDFLITQAWKWSDGQIAFPSVRQQGYAYFIYNCYGFDAGRFFDENDMWLWIKEGLVDTGHTQIDWIGSRKDGLFGLALMNEGSADITTTVELGEDITGGTALNTNATVYTAAGQTQLVPVIDGKLTVTIPAKGLIGITISSPHVSKPEYADVDPDQYRQVRVGGTIVKGENTETDFGNGIIMQVDPDSYFAYVYSTHLPDQVSKVVLYYKIGDGDWQQREKTVYPYEFTVEVNDPDQPFTYYIEEIGETGTILRSDTKQLRPLGAPEDPTLFEDDFQDGNANGWTVVKGAGTWNVTAEGDNYVYKTTATAAEGLVTAGDEGWTDYSYEATVQYYDQLAGGASGLIVRHKDADHFYLVRLNSTLSPNRLQILRKSSTGYSVAKETAVTISPGTVYKLKITVDGNVISGSLYAGDTLVGEVSYTDLDPYLNGKVGVRTFFQTFSIDNVRVEKITPSSGQEE